MSKNIKSITDQMKILIAKLNEINDVPDLSFEGDINLDSIVDILDIILIEYKKPKISEE